MQPTRQEFLHLSGFEKGLFYVLIFLSLGIAAFQILQRARAWQKGKPIAEVREGLRYYVPTPEAIRRWLGNIWTYIVLQRKVKSSRKRSGAPMHLMIFYGFVALTIATTLLAINTYSPWKFHHGNYYLAFEFTFDVLGLLFVVGVAWALVRRLRAKGQKLPPLTQSWTDIATLVLLLAIGVNGYLLEAGRIAVDPKPWDMWSPVGYAMAQMLGSISPDAYRGLWWFHIVLVLVFFATLPRMRIRHIVMAIMASAERPEAPMGYLKPISMEEVEQTEKIGVSHAPDYSRWHLMSLDACMECGRCTEVCPAWNVGKVLNPKQVVQDIRGSLDSGVAVAEAVSEEALWQCTTCNACVEACPVLIRHVDLIVDARRNLVAEGKLSGTGAVMLRQTASTGHAWGAPRNAREDWMKGLDIPLCRDGGDFEYLFWVGCAGATDPGAVKTTKAVAQLLKQAGVSFACLGQEEACTGDPARRTGEEFMFQEKAMENVSVFAKYGVKKVVTACPHCLNTLRHEYDDVAAIAEMDKLNMEVFHHTQLLAKLVEEGKLKPASADGVVIHDPCYLGRVNNEADAPRALLGEHTNYNEQSPDGIGGLIRPKQLLEPEFYARKTRCCGAGGGRMWMEEEPDQRPGNRRAEELLATGAKTVALGCPFCRIMLDASIKQVTDDEIRLVDLAEMLQESNQGPA